jgi:hypothetical protein
MKGRRKIVGKKRGAKEKKPHRNKCAYLNQKNYGT